MRQRKFGFLFVVLLVAFGLLFTGGEARAITFEYGITFIGMNQNEIHTQATYTYTLNKLPGSADLSYIDIGIPVAINLDSTNNYSVALIGAIHESTVVFGVGEGDLGTKFAVADTRVRVMKVNLSSPQDTITVALTFQNQNFGPDRQFGSDPQGVLVIKAGNGQNTQSFLTNTPAVVATGVGLPTLTVTPNEVHLGDCALLEWTTTNAQFAFITNVNQATFDLSGSVEVCPTEDTTYTLTAIGLDGSTETASDSVTVLAYRVAPAPVNQVITIPDIPPFEDEFGVLHPISFLVVRDPVYGHITQVLVCGDEDYNSAHVPICDPGDCCPLEIPTGETVTNCGDLSGLGIQECILNSFGSPHAIDVVSSTYKGKYYYCRSGEYATKNSLGIVTECYKDSAKTIKHTD